MDADSANKPYLIINTYLYPKQSCMLRSAVIDSGGSDVTMLQQDWFLLYDSGRPAFQFLDYYLRGGPEPIYTEDLFTDYIFDDTSCDLVL